MSEETENSESVVDADYDDAVAGEAFAVVGVPGSITIDVTGPSSSDVSPAMDPDHDWHSRPHGPRRYPNIQEQAIFLTDLRRIPVEAGPRLRARCAEGRRVARSIPRPGWHGFAPT